MLIDGRNRLRACLELAIETKLQPFQEENEPDPGRYILAINLERRHLTEEHLGTSVPEFRITSAATKQLPCFPSLTENSRQPPDPRC